MNYSFFSQEKSVFTGYRKKTEHEFFAEYRLDKASLPDYIVKMVEEIVK